LARLTRNLRIELHIRPRRSFSHLR